MSRLAYPAAIWAFAAVAACKALLAASEPPRDSSVPRCMAYVGELEKAYDYDSYRATLRARRYDTQFFREIERVLAPDRHVARHGTVHPQDEAYVLVMEQRAAILIAQREKWVGMVPFLLQYLDYAPNLLGSIPILTLGRASRGERWQYRSMAAEAILSFGSDALPFLEKAAVDKRFRPELRLAALALMVEMDEKRARHVGTRLQGDAFLNPDRLNGVLEGKVTAADIAYSLAYHPKPKPPS